MLDINSQFLMKFRKFLHFSFPFQFLVFLLSHIFHSEFISVSSDDFSSKERIFFFYCLHFWRSVIWYKWYNIYFTMYFQMRNIMVKCKLMWFFHQTIPFFIWSINKQQTSHKTDLSMAFREDISLSECEQELFIRIVSYWLKVS